MILTDAYENIRIFGANVTNSQITGKIAWINKGAQPIQRIHAVGDKDTWYTVNLGRTFGSKPTPAVIEHIYLPRTDI